MKEKLTLSIEKETKIRAKKFAKARGRSVSGMVEEFLNAISTQEDMDSKLTTGSITESLAGSLPLDDNRPYKEILASELTKKYRENERVD